MGQPLVVNITDPPYNAVGDGVTDDTSAINLALSMVPASGAIVYAPAGTYLVSSRLLRQVSYTRFVGAGKNATTILVAPNSWAGFFPGGNAGWVFDLQGGPNDCSVEDLTIDGNDRGQTTSEPSKGAAGGINCSAREFVNRVSLYDIFGWSVWFGGQSSQLAQLVDCDADSPSAGQRAGNDTIGGLGHRNKVVRFHWKPNLAKADALDLTNGGDGGECSVDLLDCVNESTLNILLEGCTQSSVVGCRFYGNTLKILSDAKYNHSSITNPRDIVVARCLFVGAGQSDEGPLAALQVYFNGGDNLTPPQATNAGGWISILNNRFLDSPIAAIQWAGDDVSTSGGGSLISSNRITDPNQSNQSGTVNIMDDGVNLGAAYAAGIAVMSSYGLSITDNSINDGAGLMPYSMQLARQDSAPPGVTQPILVKGNICGNAPGVENGTSDTFYFGPTSHYSSSNPYQHVTLNTNQKSGYDSVASGAISNGTAWPPPRGYEYNALVVVTGGSSSTTIAIDGQPISLTTGAFYVPLGQQITIGWPLMSPAPTLSVFRLT